MQSTAFVMPAAGVRASPLRHDASDVGATASTLRLAWFIEIVCVGIGVMVAVIAGFEAGGLWAGLIAAAPFAGASVVELGRIPLVRSYFIAKGLFFKSLAVTAILLVGALTMENLIFGFEKSFTVRIEAVRHISQQADDARAEANSRDAAFQRYTKERGEVQAGIDQLVEQEKSVQSTADADAARAHAAGTQERTTATAQLQALERERAAMQARQQREVASATAVCRATPENCALGVTQRRQQQEIAAFDKRNAVARQTLEHLDEADRSERTQVRGQRDAQVRDLGTRRADLDARLDALNTRLDIAQIELGQAARAANAVAAEAQAGRRGSQMHRLANFLFGADDDAAASRTLAWFSIIAAGVLSLSGSVLAALHFRTLTQSQVAPSKLARALRALAARLRRRHMIIQRIETVREIEVPVEKTVEKIVEVARPELILVPVPLEATEAERRRIMEQAAQHAQPAARVRQAA